MLADSPVHFEEGISIAVYKVKHWWSYTELTCVICDKVVTKMNKHGKTKNHCLKGVIEVTNEQYF